MPRASQFSSAVPYAVEVATGDFGARLKMARLRRNVSIEDMAAKIGVSRHVVAAAERGKIGTGIGVYMAMLWVLNLLEQQRAVADPRLDEEGLTLAFADERERARARREIDNDF